MLKGSWILLEAGAATTGADTPSSRKDWFDMKFDSFSGSRLACLETPEGGTRSSSHRGGPLPSRAHTVAGDRYAGAMPSEKPEPLTQAQKAQLETELAELEGPRRAAAVEAIKTVRGLGDLSENFEYHAAKSDQGLLEMRIRVLRDRLSRAVLVDEKPAPDGRVGVGPKVQREDEHGARMDLEISSVGGVST